jgi:hypothetical protein
MPVFFIVGGYANAASLTSHRRRGGGAVTWLLARAGRIVRPTTALIVVLAASALLARALGGDQALIRMAVWVASIPLWFLAAYLVVVLAAPVMYGLHQRYGWRVLAVLVVLVALGDVARVRGAQLLGAGNFIFGWLAIHQIGFAWRDGQLRFDRRTGLRLLVGGLAALLALTLAGPYSLSMIDVAGHRLQNASPPTLALLATTTFQLGLVVLCHDPAERWLRRARPWRSVVAVNAVVLTLFLWHMSAVVLLVGLLNALHRLPTPAVATVDWWLWRIPWVLMLTVILAVLVAVFGRLETRPRPPGPIRLPRSLGGSGGATARLVLTVAAYGSVVVGLLLNSLASRTGDYLLGLPAAALTAYLAGAGTLRLLRASEDSSTSTSGRSSERR